jgi:hypothetical protein
LRTPHTTVRRGKKVRVKLRDGTLIIDKFVERTGKFVILENHTLKPVEIMSLNIYKAKK